MSSYDTISTPTGGYIKTFTPSKEYTAWAKNLEEEDWTKIKSIYTTAVPSYSSPDITFSEAKTTTATINLNGLEDRIAVLESALSQMTQRVTQLEGLCRSLINNMEME